MLKMALTDCAINEKCCIVDGGRGICPGSIFVPTPKDLAAQRSPTPGIYQGKKMLMHGGQRPGRRVSWTQLELTDAPVAFSWSAKFKVLVLHRK